MPFHTAVLVGAMTLGWGSPRPPLDVPATTPVWRAQTYIKVCSSVNAGTDNDVRVRLNSANSTWLDYSRDDFKAGSEFTYDLTLGAVHTFGDVTQLRISKSGSDGLCLKEIHLRLNDTKVFSKTFSGEWLDGTSTVLTIGSNELRGTAWHAYLVPTSASFRLGNGELESRIEAATGNAMRVPGQSKIGWENAPNEEDVTVSYVTATSATVDLDLRAKVDSWFDQNVDVDYRLNISCIVGEPTISTSHFRARLETGPIAGPLIWVLEVLQELGVENVAIAFAIHPALGAIAAVAPTIADSIVMPGGGGATSTMSVPLASAPLCPSTLAFESGTPQPLIPRASLRMAWSASQLKLIGQSMSCVNVPASDASAPTAKVIVEYFQTDGEFIRKTLSSVDANQSVAADKDRPIGVTYIGEDLQAMRTSHLDYALKWYSSPGVVVQPMLLAIQTTGACPTPAIIGRYTFSPIGKPGQYEFASRSENWVGVMTTSARLTVNTQ
jgi:hypothetical protein